MRSNQVVVRRCADYDEIHDSWASAFVTLLEAMLAQDGMATCYRATSQPATGTAMMYLFMLIGVTKRPALG